MKGRQRMRAIIAILMESSLYLELPLSERVRLIRGLYGNPSLFADSKD